MREVMILLIVILVLGAASATCGEKTASWTQMGLRSGRSLDCSTVYPISPGDVQQGDNTGWPSHVSYYSCAQWNESGGEVVYELELPGPECHSLLAILSGLTCDLDIFLLGSCDEYDCIAHDDFAIVTECLDPGTYYIVVDGYFFDECPFTLSVSYWDPFPPCCPMEQECHVFDFNGSANGFSTRPCGGASVWEWGAPVGIPGEDCDGVAVTGVLGTALSGQYPNGAGEASIIGPVTPDEDCRCMEICHYYDINSSEDGGNVKVSSDGGAHWELLVPADLYPEFAEGSGECVAGEPVFSGSSGGEFVRDCFDLGSYIGSEILIGFFFGSDDSDTGDGWYISRVEIGHDNTSVENTSWGVIKAMYRR